MCLIILIYIYYKAPMALMKKTSLIVSFKTPTDTQGKVNQVKTESLKE